MINRIKVIYPILATALLCVFLCSPLAMKSQATYPWTYAGGGGLDDVVTDIAISAESDLIFACIDGSESDTTRFTIVCINHHGDLVWSKEISKNAFEEVPNSIAVSNNSSTVLVTGVANETKNTWAVMLDFETGNIIGSTEDWSDATEDLSGLSARAATYNDTTFVIYTPENDNLTVYNIAYDPEDVLETHIYPFPGVVAASPFAISDCENIFDDYTLLAGMIEPDLQSYVWLLLGTDSLYFDLTADSTIINGVAQKDSGWVVAGNYFDSTMLFFSFYNNLGSGFEKALDTLYNAPGYPVVGTDVATRPDGTFYLVAVHYDPSGIRTVLMHIDADGTILSETSMFPEIQPIELLHFTPWQFDEDQYVLGGFVDSETFENFEFLIASTDTVPRFPECIYDCVWPGDANNDGIVDMTDLFPIGAAYASSGPDRMFPPSTEWTGYHCEEWDSELPTGLNEKYTDCTGNGETDNNDIDIIPDNYTLNHNLFTLKTADGDTPLWLNTAGLILHSGYNEIPIMLGTEAINIDSIFGLEFTITYEGPPTIDSTTLNVDFSLYWEPSDTFHLELDYVFPELHKIDAGFVVKTHTDYSGYGQIGKFSFVVEDNIAGIVYDSGDSTMIFNISDASGVTSLLTDVSLSVSAYEVPLATNLYTFDPAKGFHVYPNPWYGEVLKIFPSDYLLRHFNMYELIDITGRQVEKGSITVNSIQILCAERLNQGNYILRLTGDEFITQQHLILLK